MLGRNSQVVKLLLDAGADVNAVSILGRMALMELRIPEVVKLLLNAGADGKQKRE